MGGGCTEKTSRSAHNGYYRYCSKRAKNFEGRQIAAHYMRFSKFEKAFPKLAKLRAKTLYGVKATSDPITIPKKGKQPAPKKPAPAPKKPAPKQKKKLKNTER